ncbi:MAG: YceI family protein [Acidobacteriota bacterium]|nr:YceI family protein [Acidobacteriota bacterium]
MKKLTSKGLLALLPMVIAMPLAAATWEIDSVHSSAQFSVRHMMVSNIRGEFGKVTGTVEFDGKDLETIRVEATIDATTIDTREADRDKHLRSADFFDVEHHPTLSFKSKKAEPLSDGHFSLMGDLTIRGVTREVVLEVEGPTPSIKDPWGNVRRGVSATTRINRQDFGLKWNGVLEAGGVLVGDEVSINIDIEMILVTPES